MATCDMRSQYEMKRPGRNRKALSFNRRRMYVDGRHGQLHLRSAFPGSGGFDELTPLVCLHGERETSRAFDGLLIDLGGDRSVYAPDLPGFGESDPLPGRSGAVECAAAIVDFLDQMRLKQVDVLGHQWGGCVAAELALARPQQLRRIVLISAPVAASAREVSGRLAQLVQPVLVLRTRDERWDITPGVRALLPAAKMIDLPELGDAPLESASDVLARHVRAFLG